MSEENFIKNMENLGITLNETQIRQFKKYYELLIEWNEKTNLTGITEKEQVYLKHFYDSATLIKAIDLNSIDNFCDVGSGAGFPGIVIKILFPKLEVLLIDSLNKRINFLNMVITELKLEKITAIHTRVEDYIKKANQKYDIVTARAVAPLNVLLEICIPLVKTEGYFLPMKANISREIIIIKNPLKILNSELIKTIEFKLPIEESNRTILVIRKNKETPSKYPRSISEIKRKPL